MKLYNPRKIVAFVGRAGSGKDYQSQLLVNEGYTRMAFADCLRIIACSSLGLDYKIVMGQYDWLKANDCIGVTLQDGTKHVIDFRKFLELLGTEGIRKYDDNFWAKCLVHDIKEKNIEKVCVSDLRFPNEYFELSNFASENGYEFKCIFCDYHSERYQENNTHASAAMSNYFVEQGFKDLQEISFFDVVEYSDIKESILV